MTLNASQHIVRKIWANALRSGHYKQANNQLRDHDNGGFCCLGVLCDLLAPEDWSEGGLHRGYRHFPHATIMEAAGLTERLNEFLSNKNDLDGWTFKQIADALEEGIFLAYDEPAS